MKFIFCLLFGLAISNYYKITGESSIQGRVVSIADGDTFTLLSDDKKTLKIRLNGIDAPEKGQDYYRASKDFLGKLLDESGGSVHLNTKGKDRYGRIIADVYNNNAQYINLQLVKNGMAWHFVQYSSDSTLAAAENWARKKISDYGK